ncbi:putative P-loop containing nucleoside triphosphate hydrolase [Helianthus debilis subsp. tardiflorus]
MVESFDRLMDHLKDMMTGYENDQVQDLLKEMEGMVASEAWNRHEEPVMDKLPWYEDEDMEEIGVSGSWYKREEKIMDRMIVICEQLCNIRYNSNIHGEDDFVGLARKLYNHPLIEYMFDFRAWTCVSQVYLKKDLLLDILCSFIGGHCTDTIYNTSEVKLGERVYRLLKGRKYLVVLDDIWDCKAWNHLKMYFLLARIGS